MTFRLGCNTVLFAMADLPTALQHLAWAGYNGAELAYIASMVEHVQPGQDEQYARDVRASASDLGLDLYAIEVTPNTPERVEAACQIASDLEIPVVAIGSGGKTGDEESFRQAIDLGRALAETAGRYGVRLALKPHVGAAVYNTETALQAWREIGSPHLGLNFDPSHLVRAGEDVAEAARQFTAAGAVIHSHFRDCLTTDVGGPPGPPVEQVPGRGRVDIPAVLRALRDGGYSGALDLEIIGAKQFPLSRAATIASEARGYLNRCLQELG
ncbi:MAG TPA: sugar phosphate isomerase/epimerase [Chloroflexota bacterium]|nr:sugar phosphate isomerase/epimerase [Chloroflexota bacterium]